MRRGNSALLALALFAAVAVSAAEPQFSEVQREHWAWRAPVAAPLPKVKKQAWVANGVDACIAATFAAASE